MKGNFVGHAQMTFNATFSDLYEMMVCEQVKLFTGNFNQVDINYEYEDMNVI